MGQSVSQAICREGIRLFLADLNFPSAEKTALALVEEGGSAEAFPVDVSQSRSVVELFAALKAKVERLDLLVQTAGILGRTAFVEDMDDDEEY